MPSWVKVLSEEDLPEGKVVRAGAGSHNLALTRIKGEVYAIENQCPHLGCPLHRGRLDGYILFCPCHDWTFDVRTGEFTAAPEIKIPVFPVRTEAGSILARIGEHNEEGR